MSLSKRLISTDAAGGADATANFAPVLYEGNGGTKAISSLSFTPDLVWIKNRDTAGYEHFWFDSVRGAGGNKSINSDSSNAEGAENTAAHGFLTSFDSNGFTLVAGTSSAVTVNRSGDDYVAWCFKAGGSAVSNSVGGISSLVSANPASGFSIVSWSGDGSNATIGHGLGVVPKLILYKSRTATQDWTALTLEFDGSVDGLRLNTTASKFDITAAGATPTSTVFGNVGFPSSMIAYCFADVAGYQKIGKYVANTSGQDITGLGFNPRFVLIKNITGAAAWRIFDSVRGDYKALYASETNAEDTNTSYVSFITDGFRLNGADSNYGGHTFLYLAIA